MKNTPRKSSHPFRLLGSRLRQFREQKNESLNDVSGAVEIDTTTLEKIESGEQRPSEEILLLLISYFEVAEEEAEKLWKLAGFTDQGETLATGDQGRQMAFVLPMDVRIVYTDLVHVTGNNFGMVMNFMQTNGAGNQPLAIARVGMSREHAEQVIQTLKDALAQMDQRTTHQKKLLPPQS